MPSRARRRLTIRILGESVGGLGASALGVTGLAAALLAVYGFHAPGLSLPGSQSPASHSIPGQASSPTPGPSARPTPTPSASASPKVGPLLANTAYGPYAFQIYPGHPSSNAQLAMAGFQITVTPSGGKLQLVAKTGSGSPIRQSYAGGDKIYFIEANLGDDSGNAEFNFSDDGIVATDAAGHVLG